MQGLVDDDDDDEDNDDDADFNDVDDYDDDDGVDVDDYYYDNDDDGVVALEPVSSVGGPGPLSAEASGGNRVSQVRRSTIK